MREVNVQNYDMLMMMIEVPNTPLLVSLKLLVKTTYKYDYRSYFYPFLIYLAVCYVKMV